MIKKINIGNILNVKIALSKIKGAPPMKNSIRTVIVSTILLTIFSCTTSTDAPLPITSASEEALELFKRGYFHQSQNEWYEAKGLYEQALSLDPEFILANLYVPETDPNKRKAFRDRAIANKNNGNEAEKLRVEIYVANRDGRLMDVVTVSKELVNKYPNSSEAYVVLGNAYTSVRDFDNAISQFNKALKINPDQYRAWRSLAAHQVNIGNNILLPKSRQTKALALKYTKGMVKSRPKAPFSYQLQANVERQYSDFAAAKPLYQKMVDVAEETGSSMKGSAYNVFAHNYLFDGDSKTARENYDKAIALSKTPLAVVNLTFYKLQAYLFQNDYEGALRVAQDLDSKLNTLGFSEASLYQQKARVEFMRFIAYANNQQKEEAFTALSARKNYATAAMSLMEIDEVIQRNFDSFNAQMEAWHYILFGEYDKAEEQLKKLYPIASKIQSPSALDDYNALSGMVRLFTGDTPGSLSYFNENINPENYQYYAYFKGLALKQAGQEKEAMAIFDYISNYNFNSWEAALVRSLAKKQLGS